METASVGVLGVEAVVGTLVNFLLGLVLYGAVYLLLVYLARVQGYNAEQIGAVTAWNGLPRLVLIPLVPRLMRRAPGA
jgi:DHA2 family multidrug resistance protein